MQLLHVQTTDRVALARRYEWRCSAEFAKEAMHKQGLIGSTQVRPCSWWGCAEV